MFGNFSTAALEAMQIAKIKALDFGHNYVGVEHLLLGLVMQHDGVAARVLEIQGLYEEELIEKIEATIGFGNYKGELPDFTPRAKKVLDLSVKKAKQLGEDLVGTEHILLAILDSKNSSAVKLLVDLDVNIQKIYDDLIDMISEVSPEKDYELISGGDERMDDENTFEKYCTDLTRQAQQGKLDPVIGREKEIERVIQILSRRTKNNPCLIGEPGVGKTAIVEGLAEEIANGTAPDLLLGKRVLSLDISSMVAGTKYRGEFEARIKKVIEEIKQSSNIILFIDELHTIIGAGAAEGSLDAANILKPSLARGELQVIGATTIEEYRKHVEKDAALERRFQPVKVEEPTEEHALKILEGLRTKYEEHHEVKITDEALVAAVKLSNRYLSDRFLPDKAIDIIDEASSKIRLKNYVKPQEIQDIEEKIRSLQDEKEEYIQNEEYEKAGLVKKKEKTLEKTLSKVTEDWKVKSKENLCKVTEKEVGQVIESWTGVPVTKLEAEESQRLTKLEELLHQRIVGQEEAVKSIATAVRRGRVGLKDPKRPIGSFLFLGPTGVGKTELTKALAEVMFGDEKFMIRIDMSEYMEKHNTSKLIGSPPGYVGYDEGGQLTEQIRRKPYSVVLFDEIEKAHPDVFNILLQILDDGHITDSQGRKVDFKNTVIIMTSNLGAKDITMQKVLGFGKTKETSIDYNDMKKNVMSKVKENFKPEFINRIDEIIVFHPLSRENIKEIVKIMFNGLVNKVKNNLKMNLKYNDDVIEYIAKEGYDEMYGARPLKRAIQTKIEDVLAEKLLLENIKEDANISLSVKENELIVDIKSSKTNVKEKEEAKNKTKSKVKTSTKSKAKEKETKITKEQDTKKVTKKSTTKKKSEK